MIEQSEAQRGVQARVRAKLDALLGFCESAGCRRVRLLAYFGEASAPCGNCDNCLEPPETWDATEAARKALSCIYRTGQRFGAGHLIDVLRGKATDRVAQWDHDELGVFGIGAELDEADLAQRVPPAGGARLCAPRPRRLRRAAPDAGEPPGAQGRAARGDAPCYRAQVQVQAGQGSPPDRLAIPLLIRRYSRDSRRGVPRRRAASRCRPYVVFHDATLAAIAAARPRDLDALSAIPGIGVRKLERYGPTLLELLRT